MFLFKAPSSPRPRPSLFLLWALFAITLSTSSCLSPEKDGEQGTYGTSNSPFRVSEVKGYSDVGEINSSWQLPLNRVFTFKACVSHTGTQASLALHSFEILRKANPPPHTPHTEESPKIESEEQVFSGTTDSFGCLTWQERFYYPTMNDAVFLRFKRVLKLGLYPHKYTLSLAINPWVKDRGFSEKEVRDLRFNPLNEKIQVADLNDKSSMTELHNKLGSIFIPEIRVQDMRSIINRKGQVRLNMELLFHPQLQTYNHLQQKTYQNLNDGHFKIYSYLFSSSPNHRDKIKTIRLLSLHRTESSLQNGVLHTHMRAALINNCAEGGLLQLFLKIIPKKGSPLPPFSGFYTLNGAKCGINVPNGLTSSLQISTNPTYQNVEKRLYEMAHQEMQKSKHTDKKQKINFFKVQTRSARIVQTLQQYPYCETATHRHISYTVEGSLYEKFSGEPIADKLFTVYQITTPSNNRNEIDCHKEKNCRKMGVFRSDINGNLVWKGQLSHEYYLRQKYFPQRFSLELKDKEEKTNFRQTTEIRFNPWNMWIPFPDPRSRDIETSQYPGDNSTEKLPSEVIVSNVTYNTVGYSYEIDDNMNIIIVKIFRITFLPLVKVRSDIVLGNDSVPRPFRDGYYVLDSAIYNKSRLFNEENLEMVDSYRGIVRVTGGKVRALIKHKISDPRFMRSRSLWFLEINPLKLSPIKETMNKDCEPKKELLIRKYIHPDLISHTFIRPVILATENDTMDAVSLQDLKINSVRVRESESKQETFQEILKTLEEQERAPLNYNEIDMANANGTSNGNANLESSFLYNWRGSGKTCNISYLKEWEKSIKRKKRSEFHKHTPQSFADFFDLDYMNLKNPEQSNFPLSDEMLTWGRSIIEKEEALNQNVLPSICERIFYNLRQGQNHETPEALQAHQDKEIGHFCAKIKREHLSFKDHYRIYKTDKVQWNGSYSMSVSNSLHNNLSLSNSGSKRFCYNSNMDMNYYFVGFGASRSNCQAASVSQTSNRSASFQNLLGLLESSVNFRAIKYQKCTYVHFNPAHFKKWIASFKKTRTRLSANGMYSIPHAYTSKKGRLSTQIMQDALYGIMSSLQNWPGLFICSGEIKTQPKNFIEKYGYITQFFTELGDMSDKANLSNQPWLLPLRGDADIKGFLNLLGGFGNIQNESLKGLRSKGLFSGSPHGNIVKAIKEHLKMTEESDGLKNTSKRAALEHLKSTYQDSHIKLPSFPGFYSPPSH